MEKYKRIRVLGKGSFGKAFLVENSSAATASAAAAHGGDGGGKVNGTTTPTPATSALCVVKQMETVQMSQKQRDEAVKEAAVLKRMCGHANIVEFHEVFMTRKGRLCIVMEYCDGGDVHMKIKEQRAKNQGQGELLPEDVILSWFAQVCFALRHVHQRKVLHRDLKTQNIFLHQSGQVKLGDFGISRVLDATKDYAKTMVGTPYYLSPEIIEDQPYNFQSDVWSLGVVLYEMTTLKHPFDAESLHFLAVKILNGKYPPPDTRYSTELADLIRKMLLKDPNERPSLLRIVRNPVLRKPVLAVNEKYQLNWDLSVLDDDALRRTLDLPVARPPSKGFRRGPAAPTSSGGGTREEPGADAEVVALQAESKTPKCAQTTKAGKNGGNKWNDALDNLTSCSGAVPVLVGSSPEHGAGGGTPAASVEKCSSRPFGRSSEEPHLLLADREKTGTRRVLSQLRDHDPPDGAGGRCCHPPAQLPPRMPTHMINESSTASSAAKPPIPPPTPIPPPIVETRSSPRMFAASASSFDNGNGLIPNDMVHTNEPTAVTASLLQRAKEARAGSVLTGGSGGGGAPAGGGGPRRVLADQGDGDVYKVRVAAAEAGSSTASAARTQPGTGTQAQPGTGTPQDETPLVLDEEQIEDHDLTLTEPREHYSVPGSRNRGSFVAESELAEATGVSEDEQVEVSFLVNTVTKKVPLGTIQEDPSVCREEDDEVEGDPEDYDDDFEYDYEDDFEDESESEEEQDKPMLPATAIPTASTTSTTRRTASRPEETTTAPSTGGVYAAKATSLRDYLRGQLAASGGESKNTGSLDGDDLFDQAAGDGSTSKSHQDKWSGSGSLTERMGAVVGAGKISQLFPLFQLLCLLEDMGSTSAQAD
eukprot:CAMPEP_0179006994 /NCGR_PEP_ID=MMETSP0795-20121207/14894_1 /TAXON_ID=88552 /ORGANISM="Amoebophrya sp., Strain Ameob2" /LENGTH=873 /DNA_ID=CAMNT_0020701879 /DNA_START=306 /DNA_END=2926 /DNA_ORIENTATION=+